MMRAIVEQLRIEWTRAIALSVERARLGVRARGDQVAILGIEEEDEPKQDGEEPIVEMVLRVFRERLDALPVSRVQPAQASRGRSAE